MADQARISSLEVLAAFRASLLVFLEKAQNSVDEVGDETRRMRNWLEQEQRPFWERELRRRQNQLDLAEQELMTARLSSLRENIMRQKEAVRRCRAAVAEAEEKRQAVKKWVRDFDHATTPLVRTIHGIRPLLDIDYPKALAFLLAAQHALEAYAEVTPNRRHVAQPIPLPPTMEENS